MEENNVSTVNAEQVEVVTPQETGQIETNEPVNAGNGEVAAPVVEKPVQSAEENAKFATIRREAEAKARDKTIADMGMEWNGQPITTYEQYMKAKAESEQMAREQKIREEYEAKGLPQEVIDELVESKKFREEIKTEKQTKAEQARKEAEYNEFFDYFKAENGRDFDSAKDTIPQEVWDMTAKGKTLADAYAYHSNKQLKAKLAEYEAKLKANETNQTNAASSTGSVTGNGANSNEYFTPEQVKAMTPAQVKQHFNAIEASMKKWK